MIWATPTIDWNFPLRFSIPFPSRAVTDSILVWGGAEGEAFPSGDVLGWQTFTEDGPVSSIPGYLERHSDRLRAKYLGFIHDLGQSRIFGLRVVDHLDLGDGFSFWWMNQLAEKSPFKSPQIYDCLRLLALEEILRGSRPSELRVAGLPENVTQAISELCGALQINFVLHEKASASKRQWSFRQLYLRLPFEIQGLISLRHIATRWSLRNAKPSAWFSGDRAVTFFSYFFNLDLKACADGKFYSRQWEKLPEFIQGKGWKINWLHHFLRTPGSPDFAGSIEKTLVAGMPSSMRI
jgi:surface carbohydrate biosynthesis protein (TIGR04326 family)